METQESLTEWKKIWKSWKLGICEQYLNHNL